MFAQTKALCQHFIDMGIPGFDLIVYKDGTREYTDDMDRIYNEFSMKHITERK